MHILAKAAGGEVDEYYDVLEAFFAEGADGSGIVMTFQRQLSAEEPWKGDVSTDDYFNNSYCITLGSEATIYGGLEQVSFQDSQGCFYFSGHAAAELGTGRQLVVDFAVSEKLLQRFQRFLRQAVTWGVPSQIPQLNNLAVESPIADDLDTQPNEPDEGIKAPNLRDGHLKLTFVSQEELDRDEGGGSPPDAVAVSSEPSPEDIAYLSNLTPFPQKICHRLRGLGWIDTDICSFLIEFENKREHIRAELRANGQSEIDIQKLEELCETDMADFSHLRRSGGNRALEQYQSELYLLHENKRQRKFMLNEE
ncbi:immunity protein 7-domain-containing protein [Aspergillus pseudoustus]|uniref:Immunity protein 7-domain-containing protein n=1 Tax=Aspergillus pseudoustus TaxID=1810923 RepID=A0ABR4IT30_9EURO